ncbi:HK97 family phage prohead protease [Agathobaculum sp. LCP25S3_E8]|uniref:HK97 family phage prohead protease n=1 Tax=Agathobaculum sp. LCP25S3_E8 TaxID=3438735 RepID=UPI003F93E1DC
MAITPETRDFRTFEVRALPQEGGDGQTRCRVEGYAAVFDEETVLYEYDGIEYKEVIDRNAFSGAEMRDVVMNFNHGGKPVARTKNGTLTLTVDTKGLHIAADLGGTEEGRRLYEEIRGGYIDRMSFAFTVNKQEYDRAKHLRRITGFRRIFDVAAVDIPAYDGTSIAARSWAAAEAEHEHAEAEKRRKLALKLKISGITKEET